MNRSSVYSLMRRAELGSARIRGRDAEFVRSEDGHPGIYPSRISVASSVSSFQYRNSNKE